MSMTSADKAKEVTPPCYVCDRAPMLWVVWRIQVCLNCYRDWTDEPAFQVERFNQMLDKHGAGYGVEATARWAEARRKARGVKQVAS